MLPDLRFAIGAVLAAALLVVTALGVAATLRLAQQAKLGPIETSHGLAFADQSAWNQFNGPAASKRLADFGKPVKGDSMPTSESALAGAPTSLPSLPTPDLTTPTVAAPPEIDLLLVGAPPAASMILDPPSATANAAAATQPVVSAKPEIGASATREQDSLAADVPQDTTPAAAPIPATPSAQVADALAVPAPEATLNAMPVPDPAAPTDRAIVPAPVATYEPAPAPAAVPNAVASPTIAVLTIAPSGTTERAEVVAAAPVAPTPDDPATSVASTPVEPPAAVPETAFTETASTAPEPVAPGRVDAGSAEVDQTASLPVAMTSDAAALEPAPLLPRVKPIRRLVSKVASPARRVASRPSSVRRARTSQKSRASLLQARPAQTPMLTTKFTAATAQPNGLFPPFAPANPADRRFGNTPTRNAAPNSFGGQ
jgi:hypothetical protein